jgi:hypothetical protein
VLSEVTGKNLILGAIVQTVTGGISDNFSRAEQSES